MTKTPSPLWDWKSFCDVTSLEIPDPTTGGFLQNLTLSTGFGKVPHFETCVQIFDLRLIFLGEIPFLVPQGHVFWTNRDEGSSHSQLVWRRWWHILSGISSKAYPPRNILKPTFFFRPWKSRVGRWHVLLRWPIVRGELFVLGRLGLPLVLHESSSKNLDSLATSHAPCNKRSLFTLHQHKWTAPNLYPREINIGNYWVGTQQ